MFFSCSVYPLILFFAICLEGGICNKRLVNLTVSEEDLRILSALSKVYIICIWNKTNQLCYSFLESIWYSWKSRKKRLPGQVGEEGWRGDNKTTIFNLSTNLSGKSKSAFTLIWVSQYFCNILARNFKSKAQLVI